MSAPKRIPDPDEAPPEPMRSVAVVEISPAAIVEGGDLEAGTVLLLVRNAMSRLNEGQILEVEGANSSLRADLAAWCNINGCELVAGMEGGNRASFLLKKGASAAKWEQPDWGIKLPLREGRYIDLRDWLVGRAGEVPEDAPTYYGFVPRGAVAETGGPEYPYTINRKLDVWADNIASLYEQAKAQQWDATRDIPWDQLKPLPEEMELATCQVMTFLAENEYAALYVPAKFLPRINAAFVETVLFLATLINDEARHIEVFTKRALANGGGLQYSAALTEWSLQSLLVQEDYFRSSFLLHVLGEGTFLDLLSFLEKHAPDPVTAEIFRRARTDEGRHVAYGIAHVSRYLQHEPAKVDELVAAAEERSAVLQATTGVNPPVMQAMTVLAGGGITPTQLKKGEAAVRELHKSMDRYRVRRMLQIGLDAATAQKISELHTPNFM